MLRATAECNFLTSDLQKVVRTRQFFHIFTCKCASRHSRVPFLTIGTSKMAPTMRCFVHFDLQLCLRRSGVPFLNIGTSKMALRLWCFVHFDLKMCFAPQRRAIFHLSARTGTSAPAALARLLFEHQEPRIIEKTRRFATSLTFFAHVPSFW